MLKTRLIYSLAALVIGLAGCNRQADQKTATEQADKAAQTAQQADQKATEAQQQAQQQAQEPRRELAEQRAPAAPAPAPALKQRPRAEEPARRQEAVREREPAKPVAEPVRRVEIPAGAELTVRLNEALDTDKNTTGDTFTAVLQQPVVVDGRIAIPKGTTFQGRVTTSEASGRLAGKGTLTVKLESFELNGRNYDINSTTVSRVTESRKKRDVGIIGGGAALGAAIGAIAGGGKGAAIGAGAGAAAGTAGAAATGKAHVRLPAETVMLFTLQNPVSIG